MNGVQSLRILPRWVVAFLAGMAVPLLVWVGGHLWPSAYDRFVLPVIYRVLLPWLWIPLACGAVLALIRPEEAPLRRDGGLALMGFAAGLLLVHDAWYFAPISAALVVPLAAWHVRRHAWSQSRLAVLTIAALAVVLLIGATLDVNSFLPAFDNRFSIGLTRHVNLIITLVVIALVIAALTAWGRRHWRKADDANYILLADLIEREPRCIRYFDTVARLTPLGAGRKAAVVPQRLRPAANGASSGGLGLDRVFVDLPRWRPFMFAHWTYGYAFADREKLSPLFRFFRSFALAGQFPSSALRELLLEAVKREHQASLAQLVSANGDGQPNLLPQFLPANDDTRAESLAAADRHFARYVLLREALIEAELYFCLPAPNLSPEDALREVPESTKTFQVALKSYRRPGEAAEAANSLDATWQNVADGYFDLWVETVDRLFIRHADQIGSAATVAAPVSLRQITCNLLGARQAARQDTPNGHQLAADLALRLVLQPGMDGAAAVEVLREYFTAVSSQRHLSGGRKLSAEDWRELGLCAAAYGLALGFANDWIQAAMPFTFFAELASPELAPPGVRRVGIHLKAVNALHQLRRRGTFGVETTVQSVVLDYLSLDELAGARASNGNLPATFLACAFAGHAIRAEATPSTKT